MSTMIAPRQTALGRTWTVVLTSLQALAGAHRDELDGLGSRASNQYATLGLALLLNFIVMAAAWMKVGLHYWGAIGLVVPGLVIPGLFILCIDRLVAMRPRTLTAELAPYSPQHPVGARWEPMLRIGSAAVLSALTTLTLLVSQAGPSIKRLQDDDARKANMMLRAEIVERGEQQYRVRMAHAQAAEAAAIQERNEQQQRSESVASQLDEVERRARQSRDDAAMEAGGLGNRLQGRGPRFAAQEQMALQNEQVALALRERVRQHQAARQAAARALADAQRALAQAVSDRNRDQAEVDDVMKLDPRHVVPVRGLFADVSAFLRLYADPREGPGQWLLTILAAGVLFALECGALLAIALNPSSPLDVLRTARHREQAAGIVADSELRVAQARARMGAPLRVRPVDAEGPPQARDTMAGGAA